MVSPKKLREMANKWQRMASLGKRVSMQTDARLDADECSTSSVADKGCFIVYTSDARRFTVPLSCLKSSLFAELLKMSEDEFGLPSDGPITLPCDAVSMEYILSLLRRRGSKSLDKVSLDSVFKYHRSPCSSLFSGLNQQAVCSI